MAAVDKEKVNSSSLDRRRRSPARSKSTRVKPSVLPVIKRSGSMENVCTGTLVKDLPDEFLVHLDPAQIGGQIMDLDGILRKNGTNSTLLKDLEGHVTPSRSAVRRMSHKKRNAVSTSPERYTEEEIDSGNPNTKLVHSSVSIKLLEEDGSTVNKSVTDAQTLSTACAIKGSVLRDSSISNDSGIGTEISREVPSTHGVSTENSPTEMGTSDRLLPPLTSIKSAPVQQRLKERPDSMLSQLCVMTVALPAGIHEGQKGRGAVLKFRFSPHTLIETLRVAILKQFHERFDLPVEKLSKLHLCRYLEDEEGWEYLEEDKPLQDYNLPSETRIELKSLEPTYSEVRIVVPQLECSLSVQYDQFSLVGDVLQQVLQLTQPQLDPKAGYILHHVRLRMRMDSIESMVFFNIQNGDVLECRLFARGENEKSVICTIKIPAVQSNRKVKVCLDDTVGELMSTLMRRVPEPDSPKWAHMSLYLRSKDSEVPGLWMEDYKFLQAYKLKPTDVIEFKPKYRPMKFELRVYPHDHEGDNHVVYATPELLISQDSYVCDVVDLLCNSCSLEYDPRLYGLYLHDDQPLPNDISMWDHLDDSVPGYQDSLVLHMFSKPVMVGFENEEDSVATINVDFSQPCQVIRDMLCRRYGCRYHNEYGLRYEGNGITLALAKSLHNQGVLEQEKIELFKLEDIEVTPTSPIKTQLMRKDSQSASMENEAGSRESLAMVEDDCNIWDEGEDSETNIRFDKKRPGVVVGASFNKLIERITSVTDHDIEFVKTFLLTYQSFSTPDKLLRKLIERYNVVIPEGMPRSQFGHVRQTIQARVINALRLWVEYGVDFKDNITLQDNILHFISTVLVMDHPRLCRPLRTNILSIRGIIQKKNVKMFRDPPPPVKLPINPSPVLSVFDFDPEEIARQLTLIDYALFSKIKPAELLNQAWQKARLRHRAQNILRLVERVNNLTLWVATTILSQKDIHQRAKRITDFIQICVHLHSMNNFCTLMAILNGLAHHSINRLQKTMGKIDKVNRQKLNDMQEMARPGNNNKLLRDELKKASNPCIPYLGLYMSDLTFVDNGNPNFHSDNLINFSKCRLIYHQIRNLVLRQDKSYNFEEVSALHESVMKFNFLDDDTLYEVSLQREPRDKPKNIP